MIGHGISVLTLVTAALASVAAIPQQKQPTAAAAADLLPRAIGDRCQGLEGSGTCQRTSNCRGISYPQPFCPNDPNDVQCCVEIPCQVNSGQRGFCRSVANNGCAGGRFDPGNHCPGPQDIQCCLKDDGGSTQPPGVEVGDKVLAKAMTAAGVPYAWGGGSCSGPTKDSKGPNGEPWDYGEIGYDCSGLVAWALCQTTGRNLFVEPGYLRNTQYMYCATEAQLRYKKYPFAQRKKGDAVFFGGSCDCADWGSIYHVGLVMEDGGSVLWNAPNDEINEVKAMSLSEFSQAPCPLVVRFTT